MCQRRRGGHRLALRISSQTGHGTFELSILIIVYRRDVMHVWVSRYCFIQGATKARGSRSEFCKECVVFVASWLPSRETVFAAWSRDHYRSGREDNWLELWDSWKKFLSRI